MSGQITPGRLIGLLVKRGAVPADAISTTHGRRREWTERGLQMCLSVDRPRGPERADRLDWSLFVGPEGWLGAPLEQGGLDTMVAVRPVDDVATAPFDPDEAVADVLAARGFVTDHADLVGLLLSRPDVVRGRLEAWLYQGYPARLVKARALAVELDRPDLVTEVDAVLDSGLQVSITPSTKEDVRFAATRWAAILAQQSGRAVSV